MEQVNLFKSTCVDSDGTGYSIDVLCGESGVLMVVWYYEKGFDQSLEFDRYCMSCQVVMRKVNINEGRWCG